MLCYGSAAKLAIGLCALPGPLPCSRCGSQAVHISFSLSFLVFIVGLPQTMPSPAAVSFAPVFTAAPVGLDPVAAALSQVGLPSPVCGQTAIVPLVNSAVPPAADLFGGPVAIPGWGSVPPRLTKKSWLWNTWTCGSFCRSHGAWSRQRVVAAIPVARGVG